MRKFLGISDFSVGFHHQQMYLLRAIYLPLTDVVVRRSSMVYQPSLTLYCEMEYSYGIP